MPKPRKLTPSAVRRKLRALWGEPSKIAADVLKRDGLRGVKYIGRVGGEELFKAGSGVYAVVSPDFDDYENDGDDYPVVEARYHYASICGTEALDRAILIETDAEDLRLLRDWRERNDV